MLGQFLAIHDRPVLNRRVAPPPSLESYEYVCYLRDPLHLRHARSRGHSRGKRDRTRQHAQAYSGTPCRVSKRQILRGWMEYRSSTSQESAELSYARIKGAKREVSGGKGYLGPQFVFFLRGSTRGGERTRFLRRFFMDAKGFGRLDAGSRVVSSSRPPPSLTSVLQLS